jgi:hypothetical protein
LGLPTPASPPFFFRRIICLGKICQTWVIGAVWRFTIGLHYKAQDKLGLQNTRSASSAQLRKLKDPTTGEIETTTQETIGWETKVRIQSNDKLHQRNGVNFLTASGITMKNLHQSIESTQLFFSSRLGWLWWINIRQLAKKMDKILPTLNALKKYW